MTDTEFEILDELYFVTSFADLAELLGIDELLLKGHLLEMIGKGWINYFTELDGEQNPFLDELENSISQLFFLASKKGLLIHNSR